MRISGEVLNTNGEINVKLVDIKPDEQRPDGSLLACFFCKIAERCYRTFSIDRVELSISVPIDSGIAETSSSSVLYCLPGTLILNQGGGTFDYIPGSPRDLLGREIRPLKEVEAPFGESRD
ncbi:MAG: hypothetical protein Q8L51_01410 [Candidatus Amesbacteria bacterium]|nr:hypothetical protein [Candidatus Amesbacteria bacterium]